MRKHWIFLGVLVVALFTARVAASSSDQQVKAPLQPVNGSGVTGFVELTQLPQGGTNIHVVAFGLEPGHEYVSLYYENHTCALEPYSEDDVIGGPYTANAGGVGTTSGKLDDDLDEVNSVSVRDAGDFTLLACADVHP
jgi:hypothetical protein